jgi:hypothetical protein
MTYAAPTRFRAISTNPRHAMPLNQKEQLHQQLLEELYKARRRVELLEAAVAQSAADLGLGVEHEEAPPVIDSGEYRLPERVMRRLGLAGFERDISDYLGSDGDETTRPRLGPDAPEEIRPHNEPRVSRLVGQLLLGHPDDILVLPKSLTAAPAPDAAEIAFDADEIPLSPAPPEEGLNQERPGMGQAQVRSGESRPEGTGGAAPAEGPTAGRP